MHFTCTLSHSHLITDTYATCCCPITASKLLPGNRKSHRLESLGCRFNFLNCFSTVKTCLFLFADQALDYEQVLFFLSPSCMTRTQKVREDKTAVRGRKKRHHVIFLLFFCVTLGELIIRKKRARFHLTNSPDKMSQFVLDNFHVPDLLGCPVLLPGLLHP